MEDEKNPASPAPASTGVIAAAEETPAKQKMWTHIFGGIVAVVGILASLFAIIGFIGGIGTIPACDAQETRDMMSDLNKQNKFNATKYNFIKSVSTSDAQNTCTANLALSGGGTVEYDYRIFKDNSKLKVEITNVRR